MQKAVIVGRNLPKGLDKGLPEPDASGVAELSAGVQILAAFVVSVIPAVGVFIGCISARKKRQKDVAELHREGEKRQK